MAATKTASAKSAAQATAAAPDNGPVADAVMPVGSKPDMLKMKDFIARVNAQLGGKKNASRDVVDAMLTVLSTALKTGEGFNLPPLGRGRVVKNADGMITLKLRQPGPGKAAGSAPKEALAATED